MMPVLPGFNATRLWIPSVAARDFTNDLVIVYGQTWGTEFVEDAITGEQSSCQVPWTGAARISLIFRRSENYTAGDVSIALTIARGAIGEQATRLDTGYQTITLSNAYTSSHLLAVYSTTINVTAGDVLVLGAFRGGTNATDTLAESLFFIGFLVEAV